MDKQKVKHVVSLYYAISHSYFVWRGAVILYKLSIATLQTDYVTSIKQDL